MFPDLRQLLESFNAHGVNYLIVGGYAVSFYAQPRAIWLMSKKSEMPKSRSQGKNVNLKPR